MSSVKVMIKPLSVNDSYLGKKVKTSKYRIYEKTLLEVLPDDIHIPDGVPLVIHLKFGFSSVLSDWDNPIKPFQDILQTKYKFNDRHVHIGIVEKEKVKKGDEYVQFRVSPLTITDKIKKLLKELFS